MFYFRENKATIATIVIPIVHKSEAVAAFLIIEFVKTVSLNILIFLAPS